MNRRIVVLAFLVISVALAISSDKWVPRLMTSLGANSEILQGAESAIQIILWILSGIIGLFGFTAKKPEEEISARTNRYIAKSDHGGISIIGNSNIAINNTQKKTSDDDIELEE